MSIETNKPFIIGFDGLHRAGKGTQAALLHSAIAANGGNSIVVRGDGTRDGLGMTEGDPYSDEWQSRSRRVKSPEGNTVEAWNAASYLLVKELDERRNEQPGFDALIVDRTLLSRVAFLLHRGVALEGERLTLDQLYPHNTANDTEPIDLLKVTPDVIFELKVPSAQYLLDRLDPDDPKYTFRARNIRGGFTPASIAKEHLPEDIEKRVVSIDATRDVHEIHQDIKQTLARTALSNLVQ